MNSRRTTALCAAAVLGLGVAGCEQADAQDDSRPAESSSPSQPAGEGVPLPDAIKALTVAEEQRDGYDRDKFRHWVDADSDGCDTRREVLLAEAVKAPQRGERCSLSGGEWQSYYDEKTITDAAKLDIDHIVPLAEAWDSGAHAWDDQRREDFANDLDFERSLVAVTAATNRAKSDKDPAEWMPPAPGARCTYLVDWVAVKTKWELSVDEKEQAALEKAAADCDDETVEVS